MSISLPILLSVCLAYGLYMLLCWRLIGIYTEPTAAAAMRRVIRLRDITPQARGDKEPGYLDGLYNFHNHFYSAEWMQYGSPTSVVFFRYLPDAFGRPIRDRFRGKQIRWHPPPMLWALELMRGRYLVVKRRADGRPLGQHP